MPHIITITGPSGAGKSTLLRYIMNKRRKGFEPVIIRKFTDRMPHKDDGNEVKCVKEIPQNCDLKYMQYGFYYGLELNTLYEHIKIGRSPIVILNDVRAVEDVKNAFGGIVRSLFIFRESPDEDRFRGIADAKGLDLDEIKERLLKAQTLYRIYIENIHIFDHVIINSGTTQELRFLVKLIVNNLQQPQNWPLEKRNRK
jgi:guanylate kinase